MKTYAELVTDDILQMERWPSSIRSSSRVTCWNENETKQSSRWHTDRQLKWACHLLICFSSTPAWVPISVLLFLSLSLTFLLSVIQTDTWLGCRSLVSSHYAFLFSPFVALLFSVWQCVYVFLHSNFFSPAAGCYYLKWWKNKWKFQTLFFLF